MTESYSNRTSHREHATRFIKQRIADIAPTLDNDYSTSEGKNDKIKPKLLTSILAGAAAGATVDISLFPLDTFKTRLQSKEGFRASGGFKGVYNGLLPVLLSSAPVSALFFATYNSLVNTLKTQNSALNPLVYLVAASAAEVLCATVRVPIEIIKQRNQIKKRKNRYIIKETFKSEGIPGFYRGFLSTLMREIPFAAIQFPLWEYMINQFIIYENGKELTALQTAYCGAAAGAVAAAITTPMDVIKTRIMLAEKEKIDVYKKQLNLNIAKEIYRDRGIIGFFAGVIPRVLWITIGGFIYFGAYQKAKLICESNWDIFTKKDKRVRDTAPSYLEEKVDTFLFSKEGQCEDELLENSFKKNDEHDLSAESQKIIDATLLQPSSDIISKK